MKRIQIFATTLLLLFLTLAVGLGDHSAANEKKSSGSVLPLPKRVTFPRAPGEPRPDVCSITTTQYKKQSNLPQLAPNVPGKPEEEKWDDILVPQIPPVDALKQPAGELNNSVPAWVLYQAVTREIARASRDKDGISRSQKSRLKRNWSSSVRKVQDAIKKMFENGKAHTESRATHELIKAFATAARTANTEGLSLVEKTNKDLQFIWDKYWGPSSKVWDIANKANAEMKNLEDDRNEATANLNKEKVAHCENTNTIKTDEYEDVMGSWTEGKDAEEGAWVSVTNSVASLSRKLATETSLETELAREDIENINLEADATIIEIVERYEGTKVEEISAANTEIAEITLTAGDEERAEVATANESIRAIDTDLASEISDLDSSANEEKSVFREERDDALTDLALESRDSRSSVQENRKAALAGIKAQARAKINTYREKIDGAKKVLDRRPGANWPRAVRNQLLRAQRRAENVYANNIQALRNTKAKRDTQLAQKKAAFAKRLAAIKKREEAQRIAIDRQYRAEVAPIDRKLNADKAAATARAEEEKRVVTNNRDEEVRIIRERRDGSIRNISQTLADEILRLDRQKNGEADKENRARNVAVGQRDREKIRKIAELQSDAEDESSAIGAEYTREANTIVNDYNKEKSGITRDAGRDIRSEKSSFAQIEADIKEIIKDAGRDMKTVENTFDQDVRDILRDYEDDIKEIRDDFDTDKKAALGKHKAAQETARQAWGSGGRERKKAVNAVKSTRTKNKNTLKKEQRQVSKDYGKIKIKKGK